MAFRKRSFRRSFRRGFRRFRLKPPTAPQRWQACNFLFDSVQLIDTDQTINQSLALAVIAGHMGGTAVGASLEAITRRLEIGGVVFGHWFHSVNAAADTNAGAQLMHMIALVTDRIDQSGEPVGLPNWSLSQAPVSSAPGSAQQDYDWPVRIHWRDYTIVNTGLGTLAQSSLANGTNRKVTRTENLRLKRFVDDFTGLYFQFFTLNNAGNNDETIRYGVWGTLYYRWKFG